ncbi:hypothetical protein [Microbacterium algeriense]|uniref:DUF2238 domain-containing protein n=1 Tax=Microbacterium algeriense TaxID=2615184 RepID=A0ABQ6VBI5_9MICO|nr:hypothetical protein [Microbacterium algeriense]KAB1867576.1 hypothetical protein F6A08_07355 [Microbacterium algeriense]
MKEDFLRRPRTVAEYGADAIRVIGVLSVLVAAIWSTPTDAGILALATPALMLPRALGMRGGADLAVGVTVLVAAASNVFDLYRSVPGWDLVVHFVCTGAIAATGYLVLARLRIVPAQDSPEFRRRIPVVLCTILGLAVSAVWEMIEWAGRTFVTDEIFVTYEDTIGDMALGGLGALAAGVLVAFVRLERVRGAVKL